MEQNSAQYAVSSYIHMLWFSTSLISHSHGELLSCWPWEKAWEKKWYILVRGSRGPPNLCILNYLSVLRFLLFCLLLICSPFVCAVSVLFFFPFSHSIAVPLALSYLSQVCLLHLMMYCQKGGWKKNKTSFFREERQNAMQEGNCTQGLQMQFSSINAVRANSFVNVFRS